MSKERERAAGERSPRFWQHRIQEAFEQEGYDASLNKDEADVSVEVDRFRLAVKIVINDNQREVEHVQKRLESGFNAVWVVARNSSIQDGISKRVEENCAIEDRASFLTISEICGDQSPRRLLESLGFDT